MHGDVGRIMVRLHAPEALAAELRAGPPGDRSSVVHDRSSPPDDRPTTPEAHPATTDA
jgi:hypothetical protein